MSTNLQVVNNLSPGQNLDAYVQTVTAIPVLTAEEERELAERLYFDGDVDAAALGREHVRRQLHLLDVVIAADGPEARCLAPHGRPHHRRRLAHLRVELTGLPARPRRRVPQLELVQHRINRVVHRRLHAPVDQNVVAD